MRGLRLMIYDDTCRGPRLSLGLTHSWIGGALLYRGLGRLDAAFGARSWAGALEWLVGAAGERPIDEIQFWGHGRWGIAKIADDVLDVSALSADSPHHGRLCQVRERMSAGAQWWFRTCETFGARRGQDFARRWTDFFERPAAGHTFIIGPWQSGLHRLRPGERPAWPDDEGIAEGTAAAPLRALWSGPRQPNTITCFHGAIPRGF